MRALAELRRLPVCAVASALTDQLEIAVESGEAGRSSRRRHLSLQLGLRMIVGTAGRLGNRQWNRTTGGLRLVGYAQARQREG